MAELNRSTIIMFRGIRQDAEPHLVNSENNGQAGMTDARNVRTQTGAIKTRPGFSFVRRWSHDTWPLLLLNRNWPGPKQTSGNDREDNEGLTGVPGTTVPGLMQPLAGSSEKLLGDYWRSMDVRPDYAQLGARLFLANGSDAPLAVDKTRNIRPMGVRGQRDDITLSEGSTGALEPDQAYFYVVQRVLKKNSLEIPSPGISESITLSSGGTSVTIGNILQYEYTAPSGYEVYYRIYRTTVDTSQVAYLVTEKKQSEFASWPADYLDEKSDGDLDKAQSYPLTTSSDDYPVPACSFIRAHHGRLVCAGSRVYTGTLDTVDGSDWVTVNDGSVREADIDAMIDIDGHDTFRIVAVDTGAGKWQLDNAVVGSEAEVSFVLQHERDVIYQTNVMPGNIEGYEPGTEIYSNAESGNPVKGLAVAGGVCYVLRASGVQILEGVGREAALVPVPNLPPGCAAPATISDRYSQRVFFYAGTAGVWELAGNDARDLTAPIQAILDNEVDHTYDAWTHGVFDPVEKMYHLWLFQSGDVSSESSIEYRVPSLLLTYDLRRGEWYKGEMAASASGVWLDNNDNPYVVAGVLNGAVRVNRGTVDGEVGLITTIAGVSGTTITLNAATTEDVEGAPIVLKHDDGSTEYRTIVDKISNSEIEIHRTFDSVEVDETCVLGGIRWMAEIGELELSPAVEHLKKFQALDVIHDPAPENMNIELSGIREFSDRTRTRDADMTGRSRQKMKANDMGLRGRSCAVQLRGVTTNKIAILSLSVESVDVKQ